MIWSRLAFLYSLFPVPRHSSPARQEMAERAISDQRAAMAARWFRARNADPELMADVIRMGGVLTAQPYQNAEVADLDPYRLAYEAGRRDLALQLCAQMGLTLNELNALMMASGDYNDA